jgi:hypothetical protein
MVKASVNTGRIFVLGTNIEITAPQRVCFSDGVCILIALDSVLSNERKLHNVIVGHFFALRLDEVGKYWRPWLHTNS